MDLVKIGQYLAKKRKELGLTQRELAEQLNMSDKSVSKWERGVCLPNVAVYKELCEILGISINEFLAGEDICDENMVQRSEDNLIQVTTDGANRQRNLKRMIAALSVLVFVSFFVLGRAAFYYFSQPRNYILPVANDSVEMKTVELLSGTDQAYLFRYRTRDAYQSLKIYLYEYHFGELVSRSEIGGFTYDKQSDKDHANDSVGIHSPEAGMIAVVPDFESYRIRLVLAEDGAKLSTDIPILSHVKDRKYYARSGASIEQRTALTFGKEQGVAALYYGKDGLSAFSIEEIENGTVGAENDYVYYISIEFE